MTLSTGVVGIPYFEYNQDKQHLLLGWFTIWDDFHWRHEFFSVLSLSGAPWHVPYCDMFRNDMNSFNSTLWFGSSRTVSHSNWSSTLPKKMSEHIWTRIRWMNFDVNKIRVRDILETFFDSFVLGGCIGFTSLLTCLRRHDWFWWVGRGTRTTKITTGDGENWDNNSVKGGEYDNIWQSRDSVFVDYPILWSGFSSFLPIVTWFKVAGNDVIELKISKSKSTLNHPHPDEFWENWQFVRKWRWSSTRSHEISIGHDIEIDQASRACINM